MSASDLARTRPGDDSAARAAATLLHPRSVAIIGATERAGYGARFFTNLTRGGFQGQIYPVNPNRPTVFGLPCYPSPRDLPAAPDVAVVIVPAQYVVASLRQCAAAGACAAIVISAGFAELGTEAGRRRQRELVDLVTETGLRVVGPNCLGVANVVESAWVTAGSQAQAEPVTEATGAALISQSGATAFGTLLPAARDRGLSYRYVVTTGNEADLKLEDFLDYFLAQPDVKVVSLMVEGFRDFGRLKALAQLALEQGKVIVALKVGRSEAGQRAARSHTAALTGSDRAQDALFRQFGIARVRDYDELIEQTAMFLKAPFPAGPRVGVISHSGGVGSHVSDQFGDAGLEVPPLAEATRQVLADVLGERGSAGNPADLTTFMRSPAMPRMLAALFADPGLDGYVIASQGDPQFVDTITQAAAATTKPVAFIWTGSQAGGAGLVALRASPIPVFGLPGGAARGVAALVRRAQRARAAATPAPARTVRLPLGVSLPDTGGTLSERASKRLLAEVGVASPGERLCHSVAEAVDAAATLGYPVVLKACAADLPHKTELGLVRLDLRTPEDVRGAAEEVLAAAGAVVGPRFEGLLVQAYVRGGVEAIVGLSNDPQLGMLLMLGLGGTLVETLGAATWRSCPLGPAEAESMIDDVPALAALLRGVRGAPPADREALAGALLALSDLGTALGERLESLDVNPLLVRPEGQGALALDALVVLRLAPGAEPEA